MRSLGTLLALALALQAQALEEEVAEGLPAPSFSLRALNPEIAGASFVALDRFAGEAPEDPGSRVVLVSFFASWCEPCKKELPLLVQLDRMYRERGLRVLGVSIDREDAAIEEARALAERAKVAYPILSDRFNFLARRYLGEKAPLPSVFLVRRDGTIAKIARGYEKDASRFLVADVQAALGIDPAREAQRAPAAAKVPAARAKPAAGR